MEEHEKNHITENLHKLIENTVCNASFLSYLFAKKVLGKGDISKLVISLNLFAIKGEILFIYKLGTFLESLSG